METTRKSNPQYTNPHAGNDDSNRKDVRSRKEGPFHEHPSEDPQVLKRNEGHMSVDDDPGKAKEKLLENKAGAYLLEETAADEKVEKKKDDNPIK